MALRFHQRMNWSTSNLRRHCAAVVRFGSKADIGACVMSALPPKADIGTIPAESARSPGRRPSARVYGGSWMGMPVMIFTTKNTLRSPTEEIFERNFLEKRDSHLRR